MLSSSRNILTIALSCIAVSIALVASACRRTVTGLRQIDQTLAAQGKPIFRFDTFGDETFWTDTLRMHEVIRSGVSPATALSVGLKVDVDTLPQAVRNAIAAGQV